MRLLWFVCLAVCLLSGCASRRIVFTPRGAIRKISAFELGIPVKLDFVKPEVDANVQPEVAREDLVGLWLFSRVTVDQILNHREFLEEKKEKSVGVVFEYRDDGNYFEDGKWFGTWILKDDELVINYLRPERSVCRARIRRINACELLWTWVDADLQVRTFGDGAYGGGFVKLASRGGYEEDGCFRKSVDVSDRRGGRVLFTETIVESPTVLRRLDVEVQDQQGPVAEERKKNLDSLLKARVIAEEEYKKELEKLK